jgi:glyoxylase-like metal-dependent hydrolase (beta-lactamase superfamily II)
MMKSQTLGRDVTIYQIVEFDGPTHDAQWMLPGATPEILLANKDMLDGEFWMPLTNRLVFSYQLWVIKTSEAVVLIDTGCGNHKKRASAFQNMVNAPTLEWLEAIGAGPEQVTHVLHTHLHADHVGWNTRLLDGRWVPTFPNATYYMPKLDYDLFTQRLATKMAPEFYEDVVADSIVPVVNEGLTRFIEPGEEVAGFRAEAAPGHTPGQMIYAFRYGGEDIMFSGDVFHSPIQVLHPEINSRWCEDPAQARETRYRLLKWAARANARLLPAHIQGLDGWRIGEKDDVFSLDLQRSGAASSEPHPQELPS